MQKSSKPCSLIFLGFFTFASCVNQGMFLNFSEPQLPFPPNEDDNNCLKINMNCKLNNVCKMPGTQPVLNEWQLQYYIFQLPWHGIIAMLCCLVFRFNHSSATTYLFSLCFCSPPLFHCPRFMVIPLMVTCQSLPFQEGLEQFSNYVYRPRGGR